MIGLGKKRSSTTWFAILQMEENVGRWDHATFYQLSCLNATDMGTFVRKNSQSLLLYSGIRKNEIKGLWTQAKVDQIKWTLLISNQPSAIMLDGFQYKSWEQWIKGTSSPEVWLKASIILFSFSFFYSFRYKNNFRSYLPIYLYFQKSKVELCSQLCSSWSWAKIN